MAQQYIGSRISLISKSDIRYRGILHSIDPAASTVSLEQVRSMGTEGRKSNPAEEIAPTDQLYEFIVFRAADVKDLSIEAPAEPKPEPPKPSVPDDPAIMSTTAPPRAPPNPYMQQNMMGPPQGMYNNNMPPMMYPPGNVPPQWPPYGMPPPGQMHPMTGFPPQPMPPPAQQVNHQLNQPHPQPPTKPNNLMGGKAVPPHKIDPTGSPAANQKAAPLASNLSPTKQSSSLASNAIPANSAPQSSATTGAAPPSSQNRGPMGVNGAGGATASGAGKSVFGTTTAMDMMASIAAISPQQQQGQQTGSASQQKYPTNNQANKNPPIQNGSQPIPHSQPGGLQPSTSQPQSQQQQHHQMRHPLPQVPNNNNKAKAGPKPHGAGQSNNSSHRTNQNHHQSSSTPIVPAQDFDFASANAKFNKAAPSNQSKATEDGSSAGATKEGAEGSSTTDGTTEERIDGGGDSKKQLEDDFVIPEAPPGTYYDKKKSFFDDISSEVKERSAISSQQDDSTKNSTGGGPNGGGGPGFGRGTRAPSAGGGGHGAGGRGGGGRGWDRNAERQKNLDTFGEVALNPNLGALGSGYNGYGRGGAHRMGQMGGNLNGYNRGGMSGRGGRGGQGRGQHHQHHHHHQQHHHHHHQHPHQHPGAAAAASGQAGFPVNLRGNPHLNGGFASNPVNQQ
ncbi:hypothetical protein Pst134EA_002569 [Puccinia striiformis f. sp. tritici]|uniref:hypothetical protein n=1 Tax=Puccinia striiformis f. sp. tritici TaxID=168172 RepID=UPI00200747F7|nr:hypothetical protein Pst134EA_002569 [Puccinia striiformis f. sp. tritici]KAH9471940.1 hypothetical protein Pst134EA_002569 [Puccinia striiformis f. sp. tritici]